MAKAAIDFTYKNVPQLLTFENPCSGEQHLGTRTGRDGAIGSEDGGTTPGIARKGAVRI